jgi:hypothetical protein
MRTFTTVTLPGFCFSLQMIAGPAVELLLPERKSGAEGNMDIGSGQKICLAPQNNLHKQGRYSTCITSVDAIRSNANAEMIVMERPG